MLYLHYVHYGSGSTQWQILEVLAAEFAVPNPAVKAVEFDIHVGAKQINNL
jgi:hypothetical protein